MKNKKNKCVFDTETAIIMHFVRYFYRFCYYMHYYYYETEYCEFMAEIKPNKNKCFITLSLFLE